MRRNCHRITNGTCCRPGTQTPGADIVAVVLNPPHQQVDRFYVGMALACVLIAFGGFAPTYWLQLVPGTFVGPPLLHIHGLLFSAWPVLLLTQVLLVAN